MHRYKYWILCIYIQEAWSILKVEYEARRLVGQGQAWP
jgi:hypothetical protein